MLSGDSDWRKVDDVNTMKCVSVGEAGVWGVKAKDESVWVRSYSQDGKAAGKVPMDKDAGADWMKLQVRTVYAWYRTLLP